MPPLMTAWESLLGSAGVFVLDAHGLEVYRSSSPIASALPAESVFCPSTGPQQRYERPLNAGAPRISRSLFASQSAWLA
jgi:hypothetical protein